MPNPPPSDRQTIDYYDTHAEQFAADTVTLEMSKLYQPFLARLPERAKILDAGCGPGRDAAAFQAMGHEVEAFDASGRMAELASRRLGKPVRQMRFQELQEVRAFDGIWACASLLHVPDAELAEVMTRLQRALKPGGVLYASFKYGSGQVERNGRIFTDLDQEGLQALVETVEGLALEHSWVTGDIREGRGDERWLNAILRCTS